MENPIKSFTLGQGGNLWLMPFCREGFGLEWSLYYEEDIVVSPKEEAFEYDALSWKQPLVGLGLNVLS